MAKAAKTAQGTWRIQFMVNGVREGGTFATKREADDFKARKTSEILSLANGKGGTVYTLGQVLDRYAEEVSPRKRGEAKEIIRLAAFKRQALPINAKLSSVTTADLVKWRDARLKINARGSVLRDITLLGNVFEIARREWQLIDVNPMKDVGKPANPDHRTRVITGREIRSMLRVLGHGGPIRTVSQSVAMCFLVALSTGMRAGELCAIQWADVRGDYVKLHISKTGAGRDVPLSPYARRVIARMTGWDQSSVFGLTSQTLDALFRKYRKRAGLDGFTFHDARHTAATRLAMSRRVDALQLCRIFGWKNPKQAMTYFNPTASQIAANL
jgi:integrase